MWWLGRRTEQTDDADLRLCFRECYLSYYKGFSLCWQSNMLLWIHSTKCRLFQSNTLIVVLVKLCQTICKFLVIFSFYMECSWHNLNIKGSLSNILLFNRLCTIASACIESIYWPLYWDTVWLNWLVWCFAGRPLAAQQCITDSCEQLSRCPCGSKQDAMADQTSSTGTHPSWVCVYFLSLDLKGWFPAQGLS